MGMNFSNLVIPQQFGYQDNIPKTLNFNTNFEIEIPGYDGYFYNFYENCVYSSNKGQNRFLPGRMRIKTYTEPEDKKSNAGEEYVIILRSVDNCRKKTYLRDIRNEIYKMIFNLNQYNYNNKIILPGIVYY